MSSVARRALASAGGTRDRNKTMRGGGGLRQRVKASKARSLATSRGRGVPVGSQGERQSDACHVFDEVPALRARAIEVGRDRTRSLACWGRLRHASGSLVVSQLGETRVFRKIAMSMAV
jgi:hypothetical protein